ncbi:MAG: metallophosphoesterase [Candidatus Peribacteraceae bacterium]|nr:metallophosphoesterase [Candidatus Peribacteraceae bacterium]
MSDFEKIYNDIKKYPTIKHVADKIGVHPRTVGKKAAKMRENGVTLVTRTPSRKKDIVDTFNQDVPAYRKKKDRHSKNERILVISDMHIPYQHPDAIAFLTAIKKKYKPDRVVCIGDEVDNHAMSFHDSDPDIYSAGHELKRARAVIKDVEKLFSEMDLVESNHGSLYFRKAKSHGIPKEALVPYNELLQVGDGWRWHFDLTIKMSDGESVYFHHGKTSDALNLSRNTGFSACQGHYHSRFKCDYWANTRGLYWGLQVGCLIDDKATAFAYNKTTTERPLIGCGIIINGQPKLLPLVMNDGGEWNRKVD